MQIGGRLRRRNAVSGSDLRFRDSIWRRHGGKWLLRGCVDWFHGSLSSNKDGEGRALTDAAELNALVKRRERSFSHGRR